MAVVIGRQKEEMEPLYSHQPLLGNTRSLISPKVLNDTGPPTLSFDLIPEQCQGFREEV